MSAVLTPAALLTHETEAPCPEQGDRRRVGWPNVRDDSPHSLRHPFLHRAGERLRSDPLTVARRVDDDRQLCLTVSGIQAVKAHCRHGTAIALKDHQHPARISDHICQPCQMTLKGNVGVRRPGPARDLLVEAPVPQRPGIVDASEPCTQGILHAASLGCACLRRTVKAQRGPNARLCIPAAGRPRIKNRSLSSQMTGRCAQFSAGPAAPPGRSARGGCATNPIPGRH